MVVAVTDVAAAITDEKVAVVEAAAIAVVVVVIVVVVKGSIPRVSQGQPQRLHMACLTMYQQCRWHRSYSIFSANKRGKRRLSGSSLRRWKGQHLQHLSAAFSRRELNTDQVVNTCTHTHNLLSGLPPAGGTAYAEIEVLLC